MASNAAQDSDQCRVLVVDDHAMICELLAEALGDEGYAVQTVYNGWAALELLQSWDVDLILLDLMMPIMDGWAFRRAQLADPRLAAIPVVIMSAGPAGPRAAGDLTAAAVIPKPYSLDMLLETVSQLTARAS